MAYDSRVEIPRIVKVLMSIRGLTAGQLAAAIGLSDAQMSARMVGKNRFSVDELVLMAEVLRVHPNVWFDEPENVSMYFFRTGSRPTPATAEVQPLPRSVVGDEDLAVAI